LLIIFHLIVILQQIILRLTDELKRTFS